MQRSICITLPLCLILAACGGAPRALPDISHARVWHVNDDAARGVYGSAVPHHTAVQPHHHTPIYPPSTAYTKQPNPSAAAAYRGKTNDDFLPLIMQAENQSSGYIKNILAKSREMTLFHKEIIQGGCWDYLDAAWTRAGVNRNMRQTVYKSSHGGAYANVDDLRAGDWIYHVNHSYNNIEHSGMFIGWVDKSRNLGLTLSYAGEGRQEPARYKVYDLSSVYNIMRAPS